jgi:hypothetical protein
MTRQPWRRYPRSTATTATPLAVIPAAAPRQTGTPHDHAFAPHRRSALSSPERPLSGVVGFEPATPVPNEAHLKERQRLQAFSLVYDRLKSPFCSQLSLVSLAVHWRLRPRLKAPRPPRLGTADGHEREWEVTNDRLWFHGRRPFSFGLGKERPDCSAFIGSASRRRRLSRCLNPGQAEARESLGPWRRPDGWLVSGRMGDSALRTRRRRFRLLAVLDPLAAVRRYALAIFCWASCSSSIVTSPATLPSRSTRGVPAVSKTQ